MTRSNVQLGGQELKLDADGDTSIQVSSDDVMVFDTGGSERMRIESGHLLIGTTNDNISAEASNTGINLKANGTVEVSRSSNTVMFINRGTDDGNVLEIRRGGVTCLELGTIGQSNGFVEGNGDRAGISFGGADITPRKNGADSDDGVNLGHPSVRWDVVYAGSSSINTSDQNEKQDIEALTDTEMKVAKRISALFKKFKFKNSVSKKDSDARTHIGVIAQEVESAFTAEGLDASKYAFWCKNTWWEKEITFDSIKSYKDIKKEETDGYTKRVRHGIRYAELLSFLSAYNEQRFASIEARIKKLEDG